MRRKYETSIIFPGLTPKIVLPDDKSKPNINVRTHGGIGLTDEWMNNMRHHVKEHYRWHICKTLDPKYFIWNYYSYFVENYKFVIEFEYLNRNSSKQEHRSVVRGNLYTNEEFRFGLDWRNNKWALLQQIMIEYLHNSGGYGSMRDLEKNDVKTNSAKELFDL